MGLEWKMYEYLFSVYVQHFFPSDGCFKTPVN